MIKNLEIENFKSIKHLGLDCKRINIFIGEPNTGKSNILETLGLLSHCRYGQHSSYGDFDKNFVRFENMTDLFYDGNINDKIKIRIDGNVLQVKYQDKYFKGFYNQKEAFSYDNIGKGTNHQLSELEPFGFYRFKVRGDFPSPDLDYLRPPSGDNLLALLMAHKELKELSKRIFGKYGLKMVLRPQKSNIEVQKEIEGVIIAYPYSLVSDTLQRIIFYLVAIETNKNFVVAFEEPEAHAFPYYTKYLAERIALDKNNNQYFIATHNPYILLSILEKAHKDDVAIFITYFEDYQTKVKPLSEKDLEEIMDLGIDIFFNIERFLDVKE